jgi:hypothetical protein
MGVNFEAITKYQNSLPIYGMLTLRNDIEAV